MSTFERGLDKLTEITQEILGETITGIQMQSGGVNFLLPATGNMILNFANCTVGGIQNNFTVTCGGGSGGNPGGSFGQTQVFGSSLTFAGESPVYADQFPGADIGAQVNSAISAGYKHILIPAGVMTFATPIDAHETQGIIIEGMGGQASGPAATQMTYTGTGVRIVDARSSAGFKLLRVQLLWNNAGFTGLAVDLGHSIAADSSNFEIGYNYFGSPSHAVITSVVLSTDDANSGTIHDNMLNDYVVGIQGVGTNGHYANAINVIGNHFLPNSTTTSHIQNPGSTGAVWHIASNTFEMSAGSPAVVECNLTANHLPLFTFVSNWIGDPVSTGAQAYDKGCIGNFYGNIAANLQHTGQIFIDLSTVPVGAGYGTSQFSVIGNYIAGYDTALIMPPSVQIGVTWEGNTEGSITTQFSGPNPWLGVIEDFTGTRTQYGILPTPPPTFATSITLQNNLDAPMFVNCQPGLTVDQVCGMAFYTHTGSLQGIWGRSAANQFYFQDTTVTRLLFEPATSTGRTQLAASSTGYVGINLQPLSGTGGIQFGSGGASPTTVASISSAGALTVASCTGCGGTPYLSGATSAITGTALTATCDTGTTTVTGAVVGQPVAVGTTDGTDLGGAFYLRASVTSSNTVTVYVCGTGTPSTKSYNVRVLP